MNAIYIRPNYIHALTHICAKNDIRYYLNGVFLQIREREVRYIATDGHRLAILRDTLGGGAAPAELIIPFDAAKRCHPARGLAPLTYNAAAPLEECRIEALRDGPIVFKPIDGKFPDYSRVIPEKVSGEPGAYNWQYLADFDDMASIAFGGNLSVELYPNGINGAALVMHHGEPFVGALMPMRNNNPSESPELPAWYTGREPLKAAACPTPNRSPRYRSHIYKSAAVALLKRCLPFLILKKRQAELILAIEVVRAANSTVRLMRPGRVGTPQMPSAAIEKMKALHAELRSLKSNKRGRSK